MTITLEVIQNGCFQYLAWKPIFIVWINSLGMNAIAGVFEHVTISAPPLKYACISFECLTGPNISLKVFTKLLWPFTYIKYIELCSMKFNLDQLVVSISRTLFLVSNIVTVVVGFSLFVCIERRHWTISYT